MATERRTRPTVGKGSKGGGADQVVKDPGVSFGSFRVMLRTDGKHVVADLRRPLGQATLDICEDKEEASACAKARHEKEGRDAAEPAVET